MIHCLLVDTLEKLKDIISRLREQYEQKSWSAKQLAQEQFQKLSHEDYIDTPDYIHRFLESVRKVKNIEINNPDVIRFYVLITGLGAANNILIANIRVKCRTQNVDLLWSSLFGGLLSEFIAQKATWVIFFNKSSGTQNTITGTSASWSEAWKIFSHLLCRICNNLNHSNDECWVKHPLTINLKGGKEDQVLPMSIHQCHRKQLQEWLWTCPRRR